MKFFIIERNLIVLLILKLWILFWVKNSVIEFYWEKVKSDRGLMKKKLCCFDIYYMYMIYWKKFKG